MIDRELELAAKAAGYLVLKDFSQESFVVRFEDGGYPYAWNPRNNDGDALRLAVRLRINIVFSGDRYGVSQRNMWDICCCYEFPDRTEDIRRAIVRVAADIGKAMP